MNKILQFFLAAVGVALLSFGVSLGYHIWVDQTDLTQTEKDTAFVQSVALQTIDEVVNPYMGTVGEVYELHQRIVEEQRCDSIFASIPTDVLVNISKVVIGRQGYATQRDIVMEHDENYRAVYQYLSDNITAEQPVTSDQPAANTTPITEGRAAGDTVATAQSPQHTTEGGQNE